MDVPLTVLLRNNSDDWDFTFDILSYYNPFEKWQVIVFIFLMQYFSSATL